MLMLILTIQFLDKKFNAYDGYIWRKPNETFCEFVNQSRIEYLRSINIEENDNLKSVEFTEESIEVNHDESIKGPL